MQAIPYEISLKQRKLFVASIYRLLYQKLDCFFSSITVVFDHYLQHYEDFIILGDSNESEHNLKIQFPLSQKVVKI